MVLPCSRWVSGCREWDKQLLEYLYLTTISLRSLHKDLEKGASLAASFSPLASLLYPPPHSDADCTDSPADLPMRAEIRRWVPGMDAWERVYQAPEDVPTRRSEVSLGQRFDPCQNWSELCPPRDV